MRSILIISIIRASICGEPPAETDVHAIGPVVVTGTRTTQALEDAVTATRVIDREELTRLGARTAADALQTTEGIRIEQSFRGQAPTVDGLPSRYTLVLVNGRRVSGAKDGQIDLSRFRTEDIERIEIVRGPASTLYGSDALGGVINIITRTGSTGFTVEASGEYGMNSLSDGTATISYGERRWRLALRGGWHGRGGYDLDDSDPATTAGAQESYNVGGDSDIWWSGGGRLRLRSTYTNTDVAAVDASNTGATFDRRVLDENLRSQLELNERFGVARLTLSSAYEYHRSQYRLDQRGTGIGDEYEDSREHIADSTLQVDLTLPAAHVLSIGVDALYEYLRSPRLATPSRTGDRTRAALFVQDDWTALEDEVTLAVVSGVRLDYDTQFGLNVSPSIAVRFDPHERIAVRGSFGLGYRAPRFKDLYLQFENPSAGYVVDGNDALTPESSIGGTLGLTARATSQLSFDVQLFWHSLNNLFDYRLLPSEGTPGVERYRILNIAEATSRGGTLTVRYDQRYVGLAASYSYNDVRDDTLDRPLGQRPRHRASFDVNPRYAPWGVSMTLRAEVVGERPFYTDIDGDGLDDRTDASAYVLLSAWVGWQATPWMRVYVAGDNLTNAGHHLHAPLRPLTVRGGLSFSFNTSGRRRTNTAAAPSPAVITDTPTFTGDRP